jgi:hypothetical protein
MVVFAGMTNASGEKNVDWLFGTEIVFSAAVLLALNTVELNLIVPDPALLA